MGWLYFSEYSEKAQIVERLVKGTKKHRVVGNQLWYIATNQESGSDYIGLCLLSKYEGEWGYKSMSESMGPYYYNCPMSFLKATENSAHKDNDWREKVLATNNKKNISLKAGDKIKAYDRTYEIISDLGKKGWEVMNIESQAKYRMPRTWLKKIEIV